MNNNQDVMQHAAIYRPMKSVYTISFIRWCTVEANSWADGNEDEGKESDLLIMTFCEAEAANSVWRYEDVSVQSWNQEWDCDKKHLIGFNSKFHVCDSHLRRIVMNVDLNWRTSCTDSSMTVQPVVAFQNSDLYMVYDHVWKWPKSELKINL